jgi:hypothetical protein
MITVKIDVRKLDKTRFFEGKEDANGHRPLYADIVLLDRKEVGKYGDTHIVKQSKKKDENVELPIIGSATDRSQSQRTPTTGSSGGKPTHSPAGPADDGQDIPFAPVL